ncbi:hypothetical protein Tco_0763850 [Tanacetum coccineum]
MPSEYQQDYKKTRAYAPKIYNDPNMTNELKNVYRALESRYVHEGRTIDPFFYQDLNDKSLAKFTNIGFDCLLSLDEQICPRFIMEFYKTLRLDRNLNDNRLFIQFDINGHTFNLSFDQFTELTSLPNQSICLYSDAWSLDHLEKTLEQMPPYNSTLPSLEVIGNLIHRRTVSENLTKQGMAQNYQTKFKPMNFWTPKTFGRSFNLAYFVIMRMYYFRDRSDKVLPYGMILTHLFKNLKANLANRLFDECYILVPRKMSSFKAKQPKRPPPKRNRSVGKSKRTQLTTSSSSDSPPSNYEDLPSTKLSPRSYSRALPFCENMPVDQRETRGMFNNLARALHKFTKMLKKGCH